MSACFVWSVSGLMSGSASLSALRHATCQLCQVCQRSGLSGTASLSGLYRDVCLLCQVCQWSDLSGTPRSSGLYYDVCLLCLVCQWSDLSGTASLCGVYYDICLLSLVCQWSDLSGTASLCGVYYDICLLSLVCQWSDVLSGTASLSGLYCDVYLLCLVCQRSDLSVCSSSGVSSLSVSVVRLVCLPSLSGLFGKADSIFRFCCFLDLIYSSEVHFLPWQTWSQNSWSINVCRPSSQTVYCRSAACTRHRQSISRGRSCFDIQPSSLQIQNHHHTPHTSWPG